MSVDDDSGFDDNLRELRGVPVVALVGFADEEDEQGNLRLYPDVEHQRWMDVPTADIKEQTEYDKEGRTIVWVDRDSLNQRLFKTGAIVELDKLYEGPPISTWALIPASRYVAADLLDLIAPQAGERY